MFETVSGRQGGKSIVSSAWTVVMMMGDRTLTSSCAVRGAGPTALPAGVPCSVMETLSTVGASGAADSVSVVCVAAPGSGLGEKLAVTPKGSDGADRVMSPLEPLNRRSGSGVENDPPCDTSSALPGHT